MVASETAIPMAPRSISRGRSRTRSRTPRSVDYSRSPRRSVSPRSLSRTPRHNGGDGGGGEGRLGGRGGGGRRSFSRDDNAARSYHRSPSRSRSPSPAPRSTKVVVERLTKNVNENHLREIFGSFGRIRDLDMPMNRQFNTNRGTAYILYVSELDAESAIAHMHEAQIDGSPVNVSIALPRRRFSPEPPLARKGANSFDPHRAAPSGPAAAAAAGARRPRSPPPPPLAPPPGAGARSGPARGGAYGRLDRANADVYRPRSFSRSRSPQQQQQQQRRRRRLGRSRSASYSSRSRSPRRSRPAPRNNSPLRGGGSGGGGSGGGAGGGYNGGGGGGGGTGGGTGGRRRKRSPSYSSYSSYDDRRSRSRSPDRRGGGRWR